MFLEKYLDKFYLDLIYDNYEDFYLRELDEINFIEIYNLFKKYNFYYINDIVLAYLDLFMLDKEIVEKGIIKLKEKLGDNFIFIIGNNLSYLREIYDEIEEYELGE